MRAFLIAVCLSIACAGCARVDPLHTLVTAEDAASLAAWQRNEASQFPPELQQEFADALQEIRYVISAKQEASGRDAIQAALCKYVNARTVTEVLLYGYELKLQRLTAERNQLQHVMNTNAHLVTKPGDDLAASDLEHTRIQQQKRLDADSAEIQRVEGRVLAIGGVARAHQANTNANAPEDTTSRQEALDQIAAMIQERRSASTFKHGGWPVKIDRAGAGLTDSERRDFLAKKTAAEAAGQIVIPIRIKGHWLFYEGANEAPVLPPFVVAKLTEADRRKFADDWVNLEAELWAREAGTDLEIPGAAAPTAPQPVPGATYQVDPTRDLGRKSN